MALARVKICGITDRATGAAIAAMGATDLGFICVPSSPRYVPPELLINLVPALPATVNAVGVFADAPLAGVIDLAQQAQLGTIQLHGQEPVAYCQELRQRWGRGEIIKAARIRSQEDLGAIAAYGHGVDALLLDAYHPHMLGGSGHTLPWPELVDFAPAIPWFLAGGLTPDNITTALGQLQPQGIDLSSGVEVAPGHKNLAQVERLFSQIRPWFGAGNSCY